MIIFEKHYLSVGHFNIKERKFWNKKKYEGHKAKKSLGVAEFSQQNNGHITKKYYFHFKILVSRQQKRPTPGS